MAEQHRHDRPFLAALSGTAISVTSVPGPRDDRTLEKYHSFQPAREPNIIRSARGGLLADAYVAHRSGLLQGK
jgi:hypothetical protein